MSLLTPDPPTPVPDDLSLKALVGLARAGDQKAFEKLFQLYNYRICKYLIRMVNNEAEGQNLAQETFFRVLKTFSSLRDEQSFEDWIYQIATRLAIDYLRRRNKFRWLPLIENDEFDETEGMSIAGPEEHMEQTELIALAWAKVTPKYRPCLYLQIVEGRRQQDIAQLLKMSDRNVRRYVQLGSEEFRRAYLHLKNV